MNLSKRILAIALLFIAWNNLQSQNFSTAYISGRANADDVHTAVPFLMITPDARAAAMGETGVATSPDVYSMHWNIAKLACAEKKFGAGFSYTPWLRALVPGIDLGYLSLYMKPDSLSALSASVRYFSREEIAFTNSTGATLGQFKPYEYAVDFGYSRKISKYWSLGVAARYIKSELTNGINAGNQSTRPGRSVGFDFGAYYSNGNRYKVFGRPTVMTMGGAITNVGNKMNYFFGGPGEFLPINLRLGQGIKIAFGSRQDLSFQYELNKLLVPTQPVYGTNAAGQPYIIAGKDPNVTVPAGMVHSFYDAPGGAREELAEITVSAGAEYVYNKTFALRTGYFYEAKTKGNRQYLTLGAGVKFNFVSLDFAYLIPTNGQRSPLQNTLRFSLQFQFDRFKNKAPLKKS